MSINLGVIQTSACVDTPPGPDLLCDDPAYALANPDKCPQEESFIIKPGVALICELGTVNFKAFTVIDGIETDVTDQAVFVSSNTAVVIITTSTGVASGVGIGEVTITASYAGFTAQAQLSVLAGSDCCDDISVAFMVLVDQTHSMSQLFGSGYSSKLAFARAAATQFVNGVNETKDIVGLAKFEKDLTTILSLPDSDQAAVSALITPAQIPQTQIKTEFFDALGLGIAALESVIADRKVLVLISDGEDTATSYAVENPLTVASDFKAAGGIIVCLGVRAHDAGYNFLSALATGGFFINAFQTNVADALAYLGDLKGYLCGGNCTPEGDEYENTGGLCRDSLANWDLIYYADYVDDNNFPQALIDAQPVDPSLIGGNVDLLGNGFFDAWPGSGLSVDLVSGNCNAEATQVPVLMSKDRFVITQNVEYRIAVSLAGNNVVPPPSAPSVTIGIVSLATGEYIYQATIVVADYQQNFSTTGLTFTAAATEAVKIVVHESVSTETQFGGDGQVYGVLLGSVKFSEVNGATLFFDDFSTENVVYVGPKCGQGTTPIIIGTEGSYIDPIPEPNGIPVVTPVIDAFGTMFDEGSNPGCGGNGAAYVYTYVTAEGETKSNFGDTVLWSEFIGGTNAAKITTDTLSLPTVIAKRIYRICADCLWRMVAEIPPGQADYIDLDNRAAWAITQIGKPVDPTSNTTGYDSLIYTYGYGYYGYNCYGDGCLPHPPIAQLSDPNPLPNLETGTTPGNYTSQQWGCAPSCPPGFINIGQPLLATTKAAGTKAQTTIELDTASAIKYWEVTFGRSWTQQASPPQDYQTLQIEGSNDEITWGTAAASDPAVDASIAGLRWRFILPFASSVYKYYRASIGNDSTDAQTSKVLALVVYAEQPAIVCKLVSASGATAAQAIANAKLAAVEAAIAAQNCVAIFSANEVYVAPDGSTGSASAVSLNGQEEAESLAAAAAAANAVP